MSSSDTMRRVILGYLAATSLLIGVWAQFAPRSFYDNFPGLGAPWVSVDGPYNEHLVRDVGGLNLAMAVVLICAAVWLTRPLLVTASVAMLVTAVPHLAYHLFNTDGLSTASIVGSIGGLIVVAALPVVLLVSGSEDASTSG